MTKDEYVKKQEKAKKREIILGTTVAVGSFVSLAILASLILEEIGKDKVTIARKIITGCLAGTGILFSISGVASLKEIKRVLSKKIKIPTDEEMAQYNLKHDHVDKTKFKQESESLEVGIENKPKVLEVTPKDKK